MNSCRRSSSIIWGVIPKAVARIGAMMSRVQNYGRISRSSVRILSDDEICKMSLACTERLVKSDSYFWIFNAAQLSLINRVWMTRE